MLRFIFAARLLGTVIFKLREFRYFWPSFSLNSLQLLSGLYFFSLSAAVFLKITTMQHRRTDRAMTHGYSPASHCEDKGSVPAHMGFVVDTKVMSHIFLGVLPFSTGNIIATVIHAISFIYHRRCIISATETVVN